MKYYWFSAYNTLTGAQYRYTTTAKDTLTAIAQFEKDNPEGEIADYGCDEEED